MEQLVDRRGSRVFLWSTSFLFFLLLQFGSPLSPPFPKSQSVSISIPTSPTTTTDTTAPPLPLVLFPPLRSLTANLSLPLSFPRVRVPHYLFSPPPFLCLRREKAFPRLGAERGNIRDSTSYKWEKSKTTSLLRWKSSSDSGCFPRGSKEEP